MVHQVFASITLLYYCVNHLQHCTAQTLMGPLWAVVFLFFPVGGLHSDQISFGLPPPIYKSTTESTLMVSPSMRGTVHVWQICDSSNRVSLHSIPHENAVRHDMMWRQMHRSTYISKALGRMLFCHNVKFQYLLASWFLMVLKVHLSGTGVSLSAWRPSSLGSGLVDPVNQFALLWWSIRHALWSTFGQTVDW